MVKNFWYPWTETVLPLNDSIDFISHLWKSKQINPYCPFKQCLWLKTSTGLPADPMLIPMWQMKDNDLGFHLTYCFSWPELKQPGHVAMIVEEKVGRWMCMKVCYFDPANTTLIIMSSSNNLITLTGLFLFFLELLTYYQYLKYCGVVLNKRVFWLTLSQSVSYKKYMLQCNLSWQATLFA